jgi:hypothetical protein
MHRSTAVALGVFVAFAWCLAARAARADPSTAKTVPVYVLAIWTEDADDQADALTRALRLRVQQAPGWSLVETSQSFETLTIALKCPAKPDAACLQRIADQLKADHYIWGTIERRRGVAAQVDAELHLWTRGQPSVAAHETFADSLKDATDGSMQELATRLFGALTGAVSPMVSPSPIPSPEQAESHSEPVSAPARSGGGSGHSALAYTALALGAGLLVVGAAEAADWLGDSNRSTNDRQQIPRSVTDVCADMTRAQSLDACTKGKDAITASTLAWIFSGVGAVLAGTGVVLLATEHRSSETENKEAARAPTMPRFELLPAIEPRSGSLDVRVRF